MSNSSTPTKRKAEDPVEIDKDNFTPHTKITRTFCKTIIMLYPDVIPDMGDNERALAFHINKNTLQKHQEYPFQPQAERP